MSFYVLNRHSINLENPKTKKVLLIGGFGGWWNFGDILQLKSVLNSYDENTIPLIHIFVGAVLEDQSVTDRLADLFPRSPVVIWAAEAPADFTEVSLKVDTLHFYGGGTMNEYGGKTIIEVVERALKAFQPDHYLITGQQITRKVVNSFKEHVRLYTPDVIGVRDYDSLDYLSQAGIEAYFSWDDAVDEMMNMKNRLKMGQERQHKSACLVHINTTPLVIKNIEEVSEDLGRILEKNKEDGIDECWLMNAYSRNSVMVKDTFRSIEYLKINEAMPVLRIIDLNYMVLNDDTSSLGELLSSFRITYACSSSYHAALFFSILGVPSYLFCHNDYYSQKHNSVMGQRIELRYFLDHSQEIAAIQKKINANNLKRRSAFPNKVNDLLERAHRVNYQDVDFTFPGWATEDTDAYEVDPYIRSTGEIVHSLSTQNRRLTQEMEHLSASDRELQMASLDRQHDIGELTSALLARDRQIEALEASLEKETTELGELASSLGTRDLQIEALEANLKEATRATRDAMKQIQVKDTELGELASSLEKKDAQIKQIQQGVAMQLRKRYQKVVETLLPSGTGSRDLYQLGLKGIRIVLNEGWHSLFRKANKSVGRRISFLTNAVRRTVRYLKKHGVFKTVSRIRTELGKGKKADPYGPPRFQVHAPLRARQPGRSLRKIAFVPGDVIRDAYSQSSRYRVFNVIEGLTAKGIECPVLYQMSPEIMANVLDSDLLVIFRATSSQHIDEIIDRFQEKGIPIVYDVDDLIFETALLAHLDAIKDWSDTQKYEYGKGYRDVLDRCDFATCTTDYLADRIRATGKTTFVIPNTINKAQYQVAETILKNPTRKDDNTIRIGYFSGTMTHNRDFLEASDAVCEIMERFQNVEFHIVGELQAPERFMNYGNRIIRVGIMPHLEMLKYIAKVDINIAPLELNNPFTASKSELKIFEPALLKVPTVASRTDSYARCITEGRNGFLASSKDEWIEKLSALIENRELRAKLGNNARNDFLDRYYVQNAIGNAVRVYEEIVTAYRNNGHGARATVDLDHLDIAWIIPEPFIGSGGHRNIFRAVRKLREYGHKLTVYSMGDTGGTQVKELVNANFCQMGDVPFKRYDNNLDNHDVCFATLWTTVYAMMEHKEKIRYPFYFVQDYEPMFYAMGSEHVQAENTYRMGLNVITSGPWPARVLKSKFNVEADFFRFPVDKSLYNTGMKRTKTNKNIIFFARPEMPRRCYELGVMALKLVKEQRPGIEIILFGSSQIPNNSIPFEHTNLGVMNIHDLAELYRNADLGMAFSTTNPSLVPYEMMACGLAVGDLKLDDALANYESEENIYLLNPRPEIMAQEIVKAIDNDDERQEKALKGSRFVQSFPDEDGMVRRIEEVVKRVIRKEAGGYLPSPAQSKDEDATWQQTRLPFNALGSDSQAYEMPDLGEKATMSRDKQSDGVRDSFLSEQSAWYRSYLSSRTLQTLDTMLRDEGPEGFTDWTALSFLSSMIRLCQPTNILQLGTHMGFSAIIFASLLTSEKGKIYTVEPVKSYHDKARYYAMQAGVNSRIEFIDGFSTDPNITRELAKHGPYGLIYIDTSHSCAETLKELRAYVEDHRFTSLSTLVLLHDVGTAAVAVDSKGVRGGVEEWIKTGDNGSRYQLFVLEPPLYPNVNGLGMIRRVR